jgi:hypothetical protein
VSAAVNTEETVLLVTDEVVLRVHPTAPHISIRETDATDMTRLTKFGIKRQI